MAHTLTDLQERDRKVLWHPCSQMKDYHENGLLPPLKVIT